MDLLSFVPAAVLEETVHDNANDIVAFLLDLLKNGVKCEPGEVPSVQLFLRPAKDGKPETLIALAQVLDNELVPLRDLAWWDMRTVLQTVPIKAWMDKAKTAKKLGEKITAAEAKRQQHFQRYGDDARHVILQRDVQELKTKMDELAAGFTTKALPQTANA